MADRPDPSSRPADKGTFVGLDQQLVEPDERVRQAIQTAPVPERVLDSSDQASLLKAGKQVCDPGSRPAEPARDLRPPDGWAVTARVGVLYVIMQMPIAVLLVLAWWAG